MIARRGPPCHPYWVVKMGRSFYRTQLRADYCSPSVVTVGQTVRHRSVHHFHQEAVDVGFHSEESLASIREAEPADCESLQRNCLSGNTLDQVRAGIERAKAESARGERAVLVAIDGTEVAGCIQVSRNPHRLQ
jgi:hypothetical protein